MSVITAISAVPRHPGRFELVVQGKSFATVSLESIERLGLAVGQSVEGMEARLAAETARLRVYDRALNMLAFRARASAELARALVRKGELRDHVDQAIARLQEQGLLDDARFAESFTRSRVLGSKQSRRRVQQDLSRKGVSREVSDTAIATVFEEEGVDQMEVVIEAARKRLGSLGKLEPTVRRRRLYAFLARRGYDGADIRAALHTLGEELRDATDAD